MPNHHEKLVPWSSRFFVMQTSRPNDIYAAVDVVKLMLGNWLRVNKNEKVMILESREKEYFIKTLQDSNIGQGMNMGQDRQMQMVGGGNAQAEGNANRNNVAALLKRKKQGIQTLAEEFDLMAAAADLDEIEEVMQTAF
ncbi:hypothetical protein Tco_1204201 [Tanacetum coccineum]